jgi:predicted transcriptional regulator
VTPEGIAAVEAIVKENRRVTVNEIAAHLDMSHGTAHHIVRDVLQYLLCSVNYEIKHIYGFHLTHSRIKS